MTRLSRRGILVAALVVLIVGVAGAVLLVPANRSPASVAPEFSLPSVYRDDPDVRSADFRGRPIVLNFFASWCVPCRKELPLLQAEYRRAGDDIAFIGIDFRDSRTHAQDLLKEAGVSYPTGYDPNGSVATRYRLRSGLPVTVFIGRNGRVIGQKLGELSAAELRQWIERLSDRS